MLFNNWKKKGDYIFFCLKNGLLAMGTNYIWGRLYYLPFLCFKMYIAAYRNIGKTGFGNKYI